MRIVVDSSMIVGGDWNLQQTSAQALLAACDRREIELYVPQVVLGEVFRRYEEREAKKLEALNDARAALRELRGARAVEGEFEGELKAKPGYITHLTQTIRRAGGQILDFPKVEHAELVERSLSRRAPFDGSGQRGYRDALIWHNVLDVARSGQAVVFATADGDFREPGSDRLNDHLVDDLRQHGIDPSRISLAGSLKEVVEKVVEPALYVLDALNAQLQSDESWGKELSKALVEVAGEDAGYVDSEDVEVGIDIEQEPVASDVIEESLSYVDHFRRFAIADAIPLGEGKFGIELWMDATAFFDVTVSTVGFADNPEGIPASVEISADESTALLGGAAEVRLVYEVEYDQKGERLGHPRLVRLDAVSDALPKHAGQTGVRSKRLQEISWIELGKGGEGR
jgi:predicted nucleic acid-binding protein